MLEQAIAHDVEQIQSRFWQLLLNNPYTSKKQIKYFRHFSLGRKNLAENLVEIKEKTATNAITKKKVLIFFYDKRKFKAGVSQIDHCLQRSHYYLITSKRVTFINSLKYYLLISKTWKHRKETSIIKTLFRVIIPRLYLMWLIVAVISKETPRF